MTLGACLSLLSLSRVCVSRRHYPLQDNDHLETRSRMIEEKRRFKYAAILARLLRHIGGAYSCTKSTRTASLPDLSPSPSELGSESPCKEAYTRSALFLVRLARPPPPACTRENGKPASLTQDSNSDKNLSHAR